MSYSPTCPIQHLPCILGTEKILLALSEKRKYLTKDRIQINGERLEGIMCIMQKKTFYSMHTLPIVEVNKCLLEYKLILCLEKKMLWNL